MHLCPCLAINSFISTFSFFPFVPSVHSFGQAEATLTLSCVDYMFLLNYSRTAHDHPWSNLSFIPIWSFEKAHSPILDPYIFRDESNSCPVCFSTCRRNIWSFSGGIIILPSLGLRKAITENQFVFPNFFYYPTTLFFNILSWGMGLRVE